VGDAVQPVQAGLDVLAEHVGAGQAIEVKVIPTLTVADVPASEKA
jgi:hypothetical protein